VDEPWYASLLDQVRELIHPQKLPPLQVTSAPAEVKDIWGEYRYGKVSSLSTVIVHSIVIALLIIPFRHQIANTIVKPAVLYLNLNDISPYKATLPPAARKNGGGGGGGDRSPEPASKGKLPKFSLEQKAPPTAVIRNPDPKLPVEPTVVVPPDIKIAQPTLAMLGDPTGILGPPSNGPGAGGGIARGAAAA